MEEKRVLDLARRAARYYCKTYRNNDYDDVLQEAALFILKRAAQLEPLNDVFIMRRVFFALIRYYQKKNELRRDNTPRAVPKTETELEEILARAGTLEAVEYWDLVETAITKSNNAEYADVIRDYAKGLTRNEIRAARGVPVKRIRKVINSFILEFERLYNESN